MLKKAGFQIFPIKKGVGKIGGCFEKGGVSFIFILTNPFQCYLSLIVWSVCVCVCVLFIYTISISIICVSQEQPTLTASNQQTWFPYYYIFMGELSPCEGGQIGGTKNLWGGTLAYRNQISVKSVFVCSTHTFHKNVCFTVCLNSAEFYDSAMVNVGC